MAEIHHQAAVMLPETDSVSLREALHAQQQLLQKLYRELDDEREAAASATSEAMSMILRLQGEKAELKMEANQYKRMAEEKMCHAEEALALCEDIMYQKEMEIASLQFQIQSYRNRLVSLGFASDAATVSEQGSNVRRLNSLPPHLASKKVGFDKKQAAIDEEDEFQVETNHGLERKSVAPTTTTAAGDISSYWEKIRRLDGRLKEISDGRSKDHIAKNKSTIWRGGTWSHSLYSQLTDNSNSQDMDNADSQIQSRKPHMQCEEGNEQTRTAVLHCSNNEKKKAPKDAPVVIDNGFPPPAPLVAAPNDYHNLLRRIERLEQARSDVGQQEENIVSLGGEEMHLLKAVQEQLSGIQAQLLSRKYRAPVARDEPSLDVLQEAMLYFWL
ncbi:Myosin-binding protein 7 [Linum perenne]